MWNGYQVDVGSRAEWHLSKIAYLSSELKFLRAVMNHDYENACTEGSAEHIKALKRHANSVNADDARCSVVIFNYRQGLTVQFMGMPVFGTDAEFTRHHGARAASSGGRLQLHAMALYGGDGWTQWLVLPMRVEVGGLEVTH
ncbi:hypothetical protein FB45DRAFT_874717 [Roridomyces roridus]|uniref:Uncharacterized protein n=1 Tax=Roridomyces roridus TaxID=1738132 RepID=A0AAD7FB25_9AGAR|nr:hypothetical protein FB45DRAFT_874717 [Roridomyces roridus]